MILIIVSNTVISNITKVYLAENEAGASKSLIGEAVGEMIVTVNSKQAAFG